VPQVEVTFDIDANGMSNVSAKEKATSISSSKSASRHRADCPRPTSKDGQDAEAHAERTGPASAVEAKNHAEGAGAFTRKALSEHGSKSGGERSAIENAMADLKEALKGRRRGFDPVQDTIRWRRPR